jgi:hypothetical protein
MSETLLNSAMKTNASFHFMGTRDTSKSFVVPLNTEMSMTSPKNRINNVLNSVSPARLNPEGYDSSVSVEFK